MSGRFKVGCWRRAIAAADHRSAATAACGRTRLLAILLVTRTSSSSYPSATSATCAHHARSSARSTASPPTAYPVRARTDRARGERSTTPVLPRPHILSHGRSTLRCVRRSSCVSAALQSSSVRSSDSRRPIQAPRPTKSRASSCGCAAPRARRRPSRAPCRGRSSRACRRAAPRRRRSSLRASTRSPQAKRGAAACARKQARCHGSHSVRTLHCLFLTRDGAARYVAQAHSSTEQPRPQRRGLRGHAQARRCGVCRWRPDWCRRCIHPDSCRQTTSA
jgi:hypothetical protein